MCLAAGRRTIDACPREIARAGTASQKGGTICINPYPVPSPGVDSRAAPPSVSSLVLEQPRFSPHRTWDGPWVLSAQPRRVPNRPTRSPAKELP
jgi:hypothetical protein